MDASDRSTMIKNSRARGRSRPADGLDERTTSRCRRRRLIAAYEETKWPRRVPGTAEIVRYLMDQHGLSRADMVPILGTASRVSEVLRGKKGLSMTMVQRLRARFRVPADVLLPAVRKAGARKAGKRKAA